MKLRWYQREAVEAAWLEICKQDNSHSVIVMPTGSGKSLVIAELARRIVKCEKKLICLAHRKELLQQNAAALRTIAPSLDIGTYSAGLKSRQKENDVIFAGIASVHKRAHEFGERVLVIIDEAHLVPNNEVGMYRRFIEDIEKYNQSVTFIGLTATPFRLQDGPICDGNLFKEICYTVPVKQLIDEGYLSNIILPPKESITEVNIDGVGIDSRTKDYLSGKLEEVFTVEGTVTKACAEIVAATTDRESVIVFCCGIDHAMAVTRILSDIAEDKICAMVIGDTMPMVRQQILADFKSKKIKYLINVDVLTTGFDAPHIDCVAVLRSTQSAGLFAQIVGRGFRLSEGKPNCLLLDFGGNLRRHGAIDAPNYGMAPSQKSGSGGGESEEEDKTRICKACQSVQPIANAFCDDCGAPMGEEKEATHDDAPDRDADVFMRKTNTYEVTGVTMNRHEGKYGKPDTLRVIYGVDAVWPKTISEWICIEHEGWARSKAMVWWHGHCSLPCPEDIDECMNWHARGALRMPNRLHCVRDGKYWKISSREFEDDIPDEDEILPASDVPVSILDYDIEDIPF